MMMGDGMGMAHSWFGLLNHTAIIIGLIMLTVCLYRCGRKDTAASIQSCSAQEILRQRYAKGELSDEEYLHKKAQLDV